MYVQCTACFYPATPQVGSVPPAYTITINQGSATRDETDSLTEQDIQKTKF